MLDLDFVIAVHDEIIEEFGGLPGFAGGGRGAVEAALERVGSHAHYGGLDDVLGIAALYAEAIARGHVFNDANKRTGLACALAYLEQQGHHIGNEPVLEEIMVMLAEGDFSRDDLAWVFGLLAGLHRPLDDDEDE